MKRFITSMIACLCVLAAMAQSTRYNRYDGLNTNSNPMRSENMTKLEKQDKASTLFQVAEASATDGFTKLGTGTLIDNYFQGSANVEIWKKSSYNNYFRIMNPYKGVYNNGGSNYAGSEYMDLIVMPVGMTLGDVTITKSNLVCFTECNTGVYDSSNGGYVLAVHPSAFSNFQSESDWTYSKVKSYQSDGKTPDQVQLAPIYFISETSTGSNQSQKDGKVIITFPSSTTTSKPEPYLSSVTCTNSNPTNLKSSDVLQLKSVYGNNGAAGNVKTVPVIFAKDDNLSLVKAGDQRSDYFSSSQNTTINYTLPLTDVPEGSYYASTMFYGENEGKWYYNSNCLVDIKLVSDVIYVESITLNKTSALLTSGSTLQLTATVAPTNANNKTVSWKSNNTTAVTVSSSGLVTAVANGEAIVTCSATDGSGVTAKCSVTVSDQSAPDLRYVSFTCLNEDPMHLKQNDVLKLKTTFKNEGGSGYVLTFPDICVKNGTDLGDDVAWGAISEDYFEASAETTIEYEMSLDTIPPGNYYVAILWYEEATDNLYYNRGFIIEITIEAKGDVNSDGKVDDTDLVTLTNIILGRSEKCEAADVNEDGKVNVTDYATLAKIILEKKQEKSRIMKISIPQKGTDIIGKKKAMVK